eukprot:CAMPEP_0169144276 /NCGR_PEP_ID=MMETSP1015-20121227/46151_1 /TAXON_ID=342587 /ORGANISM="Karlodinium micrum, Strain CCMP2283" /LENGTH=242 /DNA_ID=CAMNT_0009211507 /DNA_START=62 /DNA_END=788 /DNA_ORIENTATION=-
MGSTLSVVGDLFLGAGLHFANTGTYIMYDSGSSELRFHAAGNKRLSLSATGGSLHGTWSSSLTEGAATGADLPSKPHEDEQRSERSEPGSPAVENPILGYARKSVDWLLRELRPVSFKFKDGPEAKHSRYGFVAQEIEKVLPEMVHTRNEEKYVVYQDMIAVLTLASQVQQERLDFQEERAKMRATLLGMQARRMRKLQKGVDAAYLQDIPMGKLSSAVKKASTSFSKARIVSHSVELPMGW